MKKVSIKDIHTNKIELNTYLYICGWVKNKRDSRIGLSFIDLCDGSFLKTIQIVVSSQLNCYKKKIAKLTTGCSILVQGKLIKSKGKKQDYEIKATKIKIIGWIKNPSTYPISAKKHSLEYLRNVAHLRSRTNLGKLVAKIRTILFQKIHRFFYKNDFYWVPTPIITSLNAEGAGTMFRVSTLDFSNIPKKKNKDVDFKKDFFKKESFLTVSGQLCLETYACSLSKVYTFGPIFRAENSNTIRHLSEFWMLEVEEAFCDIKKIILLIIKMLKYLVKKILQHCSLEIEYLERFFKLKIQQRLEKLLNFNFFCIDYKDAVNILIKNKKITNISFLDFEITGEQEKYLVDEYFKSPVFITNFPKKFKAFYMKLNKDNKTVAAVDLLLPQVGEVIGGSQREENLILLKNRMKESKLNYKEYNWYCDLRRYGTVNHSGFGLGFERFLSYVTGIKNIKDLIPFPRVVNNANF